MSKMTDALSAMRIHNNHNLMRDFGSRDDVWVDYTPTDDGRGGHGAHTSILSVHFPTDPAAPWYQHGTKWFHGKRDKSFLPALEWASKTYGITEWVTSPFGGRIPARVLTKAKAAIKAAA